MHDRTDSEDSALVIRTNPLNIRGLDGGDLVIDENALRQQVSVFKPQMDTSPQRSPERAVIVGEDVDKSQSISPLVIKKNPVFEASSTAPPEPELAISDLDIPTPKLELNSDLGMSLANELSHIALSRKNTISSKAKGVTLGPSQTPDLIQRLRSVRRKLAVDGLDNLQDADDVDEALPASMLKLINFSPNSQWLPSDDEEEDDEEDEKDVSPWVASRESTVEPNTPVETHQGEVTTEPLETDEEMFIPELKEEPVVPQLKRKDPIISSERPVVESTEEAEPVTTPNLSEADPVDCNDRGRLFLQINKLNNLRDLPFDGGRNPRFTLTLDNGMQTVTTPPVPLTAPGFSGSISAKIGQEFELLVGMDLELVVTMSVFMDALEAPLRPRRELKPEPQKVETPPPSPKKSSGLRGLLSPKKNKRLSVDKLPPVIDQQSYLKDEREHDIAMESYKRRSNLWKGVTGPKGEVARGYLFESHYEADIYGRPQSYSLPLYNEWQGEDPKQMCDLQVTLMYVPKLFNSETLPSSMQACVKELETARHNRSLKFEGYLTQNGGDCTLWRRRWFTLRRNELVGHHEDTKKVRSFIRMENARSILDAAEVPPSDDLWCIYEDRTFFVTFKDGEELSFYADTAELKDEWLHALRMAATYCTTQHKTWKDLVLDEEEKRIV
ncbi:Bud site selection protein BUD4 [Wickerhamiella sorbophila]|uniref:Bud site selection protein BUD4 n=1 Tax=Wickerhamiella sorbophila TaxID=45607 RepID=A0A2T0FL58_9ASCO|nr:Bud site selection protein BUD4 [Wickerhamiella sorbophila]PRT55715.1 Bud site selection protein BUD4 [Wickerhamiella sorbophila]